MTIHCISLLQFANGLSGSNEQMLTIAQMELQSKWLVCGNTLDGNKDNMTLSQPFQNE